MCATEKTTGTTKETTGAIGKIIRATEETADMTEKITGTMGEIAGTTEEDYRHSRSIYRHNRRYHR